MDVLKATRAAYVTLLDTVALVPHDRFLPDTSPEGAYIIISSQDARNSATKCNGSHIVGVLIDIYHRTNTNGGGAPADDIAGIIIPLIVNNDLPLPVGSGLNFTPGSSRKVTDQTSEAYSETFRTYRRTLRFEHYIIEN